ncbi:hypothetical protein HN011_010902 [Eciton burchellii]|nr:hypothetical protein HN011_010902 [Eciton burchellii]
MMARIQTINNPWIIITLILCMPCTWIYAKIHADIDFEVEGNGFHRTLVYYIHLRDIITEYLLFISTCHVAIYMELPSTLYINADEVAESKRRGTNICFIGETDVELSMEKAGDQNVTACTALNHKKIQSWFTLSIPIHQRYQYARETGGYANTTLPMPRLLLGCREKIKEYRVSKLNLCKPCINQTTKWREIPYFLMNDNDYRCDNHWVYYADKSLSQETRLK